MRVVGLVEAVLRGEMAVVVAEVMEEEFDAVDEVGLFLF